MLSLMAPFSQTSSGTAADGERQEQARVGELMASVGFTETEGR